MLPLYGFKLYGSAETTVLPDAGRYDR